MKWESPKLNAYDHINPDDFFSALPADFKKSDKPIVVYLTTSSDDAAKQTTAVDQGVVRDENFALAARLFRAVRLNGDKIAKENPYWSTLGGNALPRMVVVDTAGQKVGALEGNDLTASNLFKQMKKAAARTYKTDLEKVVKECRGLLDEMDQIEAKQKVVAERKKTVKAGKEKDLVEEETKLADQMKDVQSRESDLLKKVNDDRKVTKA